MRSLIVYRLSFIALLAAFCCGGHCHAQPVTGTDLIENAREYDSTIVEFQGEVIGDVMLRGDFAWINVTDGTECIGVWTTRDIAENVIQYTGDYKHKGDIINIKGVFFRACPEHGGDLDIHSDEIIKIAKGSATPHPVSRAKVINALVLSGTALLFSVLCILKAKRK